jgi:2-(1,2-epoxy-1,2-dihydrophenyl)acetyl-CoA isomerase
MVVEVEQQDAVRIIKMAGQASTQSFSRAFLPRIAQAIDEGLRDASTKAIVLTGEGRFFSAGADINAFQKSIEDNDAPELIRELTGVLHPLLQRIRTSSTIVVAALNGVSAGGGLGLALACDARVGTDDARMAASYAGMGLSPDGGTTWLLPRLVGEQRARRFFMGNEIWSGREAHDYGAIDVLVDADSLLETAIGMATMWSSWGQHTKEATKHLLHVQSENEFSTHLDHERTLIEAAGTTDAFREGVTAFLEKRRPQF